MITTVHCKSEEWCFACKETGGVNGVPVTYYCFEELCPYPERNCLYVQNGGTRA